MNNFKFGLLAASLVFASSVSACEKWQGIVTAESPLLSSTLEIEFDPIEHTQKNITDEINIKSEIESELDFSDKAIAINFIINNSNAHIISYTLTGELPVIDKDTIELNQINIVDRAPLRDGYMNYHQRADTKITLYGQKISCLN